MPAGRLTTLGRRMAGLPLHPRLSRLVSYRRAGRARAGLRRGGPSQRRRQASGKPRPGRAVGPVCSAGRSPPPNHRQAGASDTAARTPSKDGGGRRRKPKTISFAKRAGCLPDRLARRRQANEFVLSAPAGGGPAILGCGKRGAGRPIHRGGGRRTATRQRTAADPPGQRHRAGLAARPVSGWAGE